RRHTMFSRDWSSDVCSSDLMERSDSMYSVGDYLLRVGVSSRPDFNYQKQANNIRAKWVSVEYPADYYIKGGNKGSYMRDENYARSEERRVGEESNFAFMSCV